MSDCKCTCACAAKIVGVLGVLVVVLAVILKFATTGPTLHLLGVETGATHLILGGNTLILIALFFRPQGSCTCQSGSCCESEKGNSGNPPTPAK